MAVQRRRQIDPAKVEQFAASATEAEAPAALDAPQVRRPAARPDLPAHRQRAKTGIKGPGMNFRYNGSQRELLDYAVAMEDMTKQELIEQLVWPILEERYGDAVPIHPET